MTMNAWKWQLTAAGCWLVIASSYAQTAPAPVAPAPPPTAAQVIADAEDRALREIVEASRSDDAQLRSSAMEAILPRPRRALPMAQLAVADENPAVRFAALVTVGRLQLEPLGRKAQQMMSDPDPSVRAAAIFAATRCGVKVDMNELPVLLTHNEVSVRANAAMLLGMLGDPTAVPMLRETAQQRVPRAAQLRQTILRLQFAEAMARLGEDKELEPIRAALFSQDYEVRVLAAQMLGELGDQSMARALQGMLGDEPVELKLAAALSLAKLGDPSGRAAALEASRLDAATIASQAEAFVRRNPRSEFAPVYRALLQDVEQQRSVSALARGQAAFVLAQLDGQDTAGALVKLLEDHDPLVRLSAAAGVLVRADR